MQEHVSMLCLQESVPKVSRMGFGSLMLLVGRQLWKEGNSITFDAVARSPTVLLCSVEEANPL